jgi:hypothetical protein
MARGFEEFLASATTAVPFQPPAGDARAAPRPGSAGGASGVRREELYVREAGDLGRLVRPEQYVASVDRPTFTEVGDGVGKESLRGGHECFLPPRYRTIPTHKPTPQH